MKSYSKREIKNVLDKKAKQSVTIEKEPDGTSWAIINHDNEELSMSFENLKILQ